MTMPVIPQVARVRELHVHEGELILVDKPKGWTSFDAVNKLRHAFHVKKIGHAGTLDPNATGLLLVCTASKTKEISQFVGLDKEYEGVMILGARTASHDIETPILEQKGTEGVTEERIRAVMQEFVGPQMQRAPMWSAAKVAGKRLYAYARKGLEVERLPREIRISVLTPTAIDIPRVAFTAVCSKGTYIRTLVDDIGNRLGCGAYLEDLRRTRVGPYHVSEACTIDELIAFSVARSPRAV
jgi:tRNA pseudouridine55 synthase